MARGGAEGHRVDVEGAITEVGDHDDVANGGLVRRDVAEVDGTGVDVDVGVPLVSSSSSSSSAASSSSPEGSSKSTTQSEEVEHPPSGMSRVSTSVTTSTEPR